ncbi:MAG: thiamine-phosphate kinase [Methylococcaceae bacterium]|nr:thiamine-phosphate kinase [Methylococcaceae bacterium]MCI0733846.1 thiamine-phosphate kinase [Methylococcaceae bacterium]
MPLAEFGLIDRYFRGIGPALDSTVLGVGDDCAVLRLPADQLLLVTTDTLVENIHFLAGSDPESLGHKSLAVNLSDLAAMGAAPKWATLALTLPDVNEPWLAAFARGFSALAERYRVQLVGGDITQGPLSICVQALGTAAAERILYRSSAGLDERIYVTGTIGDAGLALKYLKDSEQHCPKTLRDRLDRPEPRIEASRSIGGLASACIDISDGFAADLGHLLKASNVGATVDWNLIPLSPHVRRYVDQSNDFSLPLCAGDDYELCFTVPAQREEELIRQVQSLPFPCQRVGKIDRRPGLRFENLAPGLDLLLKGYEHFS